MDSRTKLVRVLAAIAPLSVAKPSRERVVVLVAQQGLHVVPSSLRLKSPQVTRTQLERLLLQLSERVVWKVAARRALRG